MRRLRENTMLEAEITATGDVTVEGQHVGHLHGFHFVPDPQAGTRGGQGPAQRRPARRWPARSRRGRSGSREAADTPLVLSNDGTMRWIGEPVARLEPGDKLFEPRAAHPRPTSSSTGPAREKVETRLRAWLKAYIVRLLGPLLQLENGAELTGIARGIAFQVAEALGVLERSKVAAARSAALDQDGRAAPAQARHPLRRLSSLSAGAAEAGAARPGGPALGAAERRARPEGHRRDRPSGRIRPHLDPGRPGDRRRASIAPPASASAAGGRCASTSSSGSPTSSVRRSPIAPASPPASRRPAPPMATASLPTVAMTSLVGCSGEDFATILKSLGYVGGPPRRPGHHRAAGRSRRGRSSPRPCRPRPSLPSDGAEHRLRRRSASVAAEEAGRRGRPRRPRPRWPSRSSVEAKPRRMAGRRSPEASRRPAPCRGRPPRRPPPRRLLPAGRLIAETR